MGNHYTKAEIEARSKALMRDLEAARDPVAYRQRFHQKYDEEPSSGARASSDARSKLEAGNVASGGPRASFSEAGHVNPVTRAMLSLFAMVLVILAGTVLGSVLVGYLT